MLGTPAYMAPEQFAGAGGDARTDQFSFCVALYEGLYGQRPFAGDNVVALMANVVAGTITEPPDDTRVPALDPEDPAARPRHRARRSLPVDDRACSPRWRTTRRCGAAAGWARRPALRLVAAVGAGALPPDRRPARDVRGRPGARRDRLGARAAAAAIERAFRRPATSAPAQAFAERRPMLIDGYVARWTGMYTRDLRGDAGARRAVGRGARPAHGVPGRAAVERRALTDVLATADTGVVDNAVSAASALPTLDRCADVAMLRAVIKPPDDPAKRAEVEQLREEVAQVSALASAGRCDRRRRRARRSRRRPAGSAIGRSRRRSRSRSGGCSTPASTPRRRSASSRTRSWRRRRRATTRSRSRPRPGSRAPTPTARHDIAHGAPVDPPRRGDPGALSRPPAPRGLDRRSSAVVLRAEGRLEERWRRIGGRWRSRSRLLGPSSLEVALSATNIAVALHDLGRDAEAEASIRRALEIFSDPSWARTAAGWRWRRSTRRDPDRARPVRRRPTRRSAGR